VNLAHGAFFAVGAYMAVVLTPYVGFFGAVFFGPVIVAGMGAVTERLLFTKFYRIDPLYSLLPDIRSGDGVGTEHALGFWAAPLAYNIPDILRGQGIFW